MKSKLFLLIVSLVVVAMNMSACQLFGSSGDSGTDSSLSTSSKTYISVEEYASKGEIYGCKFKVGDSIDDIKKAYHYGDDAYWENVMSELGENGEHSHDFTEDTLDIIEGETVRMITGDTKFYYRSWNEEAGVAFIAYFGDSFSYTVGSTEFDEVLASISAKPIYNDVAKSDNLFFIPGEPDNIRQLKYEFGDYNISFFFENDLLAATTIYYTPTWVG